MGRTDQVLTGGSLSYHQLTKAMKAVLTLLLLVCLLVQISSAEQEDISDAASNEPNLSLQREVREADRGCASGDKECTRRSRKEERKRKRARKVVKSRKDQKKPKRDRNGGKKLNKKKKGAKGTKKKLTKKPQNNRKKLKTGAGKNQKKKGGQKKKGEKKKKSQKR